VRPAKSAALYQKVWTEAGSPFMDISLKQKQKLQQKLIEDGHDVSVHLGGELYYIAI